VGGCCGGVGGFLGGVCVWGGLSVDTPSSPILEEKRAREPQQTGERTAPIAPTLFDARKEKNETKSS